MKVQKGIVTKESEDLLLGVPSEEAEKLKDLPPYLAAAIKKTNHPHYKLADNLGYVRVSTDTHRFYRSIEMFFCF